jgi:ketosteroid isomerase-like protein
MTDSSAQLFADALQEVEKSGDTGALLERFTDDAELLRPEANGSHVSGDDASAFWDSYLSQFSEIATEFTHVEDGESQAWLEWVSRGKLSTGRPIEYRGVSLLTLGDEGKVRRFATYYDTAAFLEPTA